MINRAMPSYFLFHLVVLASIVFFSTCLYADKKKVILETDWLNSTIGSHGDTLGAKVVDVDITPDKDSTVLEVTLPIDNPDDFEKIEVIGKKSLQPIPQSKDAEWIKDYENGTYGLRLHLKKKTGFEFRLKLIDDDKDF